MDVAAFFSVGSKFVGSDVDFCSLRARFAFLIGARSIEVTQGSYTFINHWGTRLEMEVSGASVHEKLAGRDHKRVHVLPALGFPAGEVHFGDPQVQAE